MPTGSEIRWLRQQPLAVQLAAVEKEWQERADSMTLIADQLWSVGKTQQALDEVVAFAEAAAKSYEGLVRRTDFSRFGKERLRDIAGNAIHRTAIVREVVVDGGDGLETEMLVRVCERLGFVP